MPNPFIRDAKVEDPEAVALSNPEAEKFSGLSAKTLDRHAKAGEPVGRAKIGRRVVYIKAALAAWLASKTNTAMTTTCRRCLRRSQRNRRPTGSRWPPGSPACWPIT